jgi:hypothetical protein
MVIRPQPQLLLPKHTNMSLKDAKMPSLKDKHEAEVKKAIPAEKVEPVLTDKAQ